MISSCSEVYFIYCCLENDYSYSTLKWVQKFNADKGFQISSVNIIKLFIFPLFLFPTGEKKDSMLLCNEKTCWLFVGLSAIIELATFF